MTPTITPGPYRHMRTRRYGITHVGSLIHECTSYRTACRYAIRSLIVDARYGWGRSYGILGWSGDDWRHVATVRRDA